MQQQQRHTSCFILAAAAASALGCGSEHLLGDLSPVDLSDPLEGPTAAAHSGEDFTVSPLLDPPDVTLRGEMYFFDGQVASVGDVDGDGYADFATQGSDNTTQSRYVHLRYGGPHPYNPGGRLELSEGSVRLILPEDLVYPESIAGVGDVDADGYSDFLIMLGFCNPAQEGEGAFLVYGGPRLEGIHRLSDASVFLKSSRQVTGTSRVGNCRGSVLPEWGLVGGLGDFDGDGFDDFILTAPQYVMLDYWPEVGPTVDSTGYLFYGRSERIPNGTPWQSTADARLNAPQMLYLTPTGDANGDGLADVILGDGSEVAASDRAQDWWSVRPPPGVYWLPGSTERLSGDVDLAALATAVRPATAVGDLDGDGVKDVLAYDDDWQPHLFYGGPGLFENGVDFSRAAATFEGFQQRPRGPVNLVRLNDRDGDGDDELAVTRIRDGYSYPLPPKTLALLSGSATRQSGVLGVMPTGDPLLGTSGLLEDIFPLGDLDGDGIGDVLTRSDRYVPAPDPEENWVRANNEQCLLHIHYGKPGSTEAPLR